MQICNNNMDTHINSIWLWGVILNWGAHDEHNIASSDDNDYDDDDDD